MSKAKQLLHLVNQSHNLGIKCERKQNFNDSKDNSSLSICLTFFNFIQGQMQGLASSFLRSKHQEFKKQNPINSKTLRKQKTLLTQKTESNERTYLTNLSLSIQKAQKTDPSQLQNFNFKSFIANNKKQIKTKNGDSAQKNRFTLSQVSTLFLVKKSLNKSHQRVGSKHARTNESCDRRELSSHYKKQNIQNLKEFILDDNLKKKKLTNDDKRLKLISQLKQKIQKSKSNEPKSFTNEAINETRKKYEKLEDILTIDGQDQSKNAMKNVKFLDKQVKQEAAQLVQQNQILMKKIKPISVCMPTTDTIALNFKQKQEKQQPQSDSQFQELIKIFESSLDNFIQNQNQSLAQEEGINIKYIEQLLNLFEQLAGKDTRFSNIFEKIQVAVGVMVHKAIEQIIELRSMIMDLSNQVESLEAIKLQKIQLESKYSKEKKINEKFEEYKDYISKFIAQDSTSVDSFKILEENQRLRAMLTKQKRNYCEIMQKEEKVMKLLYAIRQQGVDIEGIYKECITPEISTDNSKNEGKKMGEKVDKDLLTLSNLNTNQVNFHKQKIPQNQQHQNEILNSDSEDLDFLMYQYQDSQPPQHNNNKQMKLNLQQIQNTNQPGFHAEFMSKINEWSESWRLAAEKEKKF